MVHQHLVEAKSRKMEQTQVGLREGKKVMER